MRRQNYNRGFSIPLAISIVALFFVGGGIIHSHRINTNINSQLSVINGLIARVDSFDEIRGRIIMEVATSTATSTESSLSGRYEVYESGKIPPPVGERVVLFFHAPWSELSRDLDMDIMTNNDQIPERVLILKTDYDKRTSLKEKYEVKTEHTLVEINQTGDLVKKWIGGVTLNSIINELR
jgi:hypothetical protein